MSLTDPGTAARDELHRQALRLGLRVLDDQPDRITDALYLVYSAFRYRFLDERGLLDSVPGRDARSIEALKDARALEKYVAECWAEAILNAYDG